MDRVDHSDRVHPVRTGRSERLTKMAHWDDALRVGAGANFLMSRQAGRVSLTDEAGS
jgi:hypothetical protein